MVVDDFLIERNPKTWGLPKGFPRSLRPGGMFEQEVPSGLEVVLVQARSKPSSGELRTGWSKRRGGRATPVLLVAFYRTNGEERVALCGPTGDEPLVQFDIEPSQAERLAEVALREPSHHAATRFLLSALPELDSPFPGLRNVGLLATQELKSGVPRRSDWKSATTKSRPLLAHRGRKLVKQLGFEICTLATNAKVLTVGGRKQAVAVFCDDNEPFDVPSARFDSASPVSRALALADQENVDWVVLTRASEIRLYAARRDTGVGRKGRAETFIELNLALLPAEKAGYLHLLFSADALMREGTLAEILEHSADFSADLAERLRERVYHETVPALAKAVSRRLSQSQDTSDLTEADLAEAYEQVMVILFRLLFVAYAEDKDLLPYRKNSKYELHSLSRIARSLTEDKRSRHLRYDQRATDLWDDVRQLWRVISRGNRSWGVPEYNGSLFSSDPEVSRPGSAIKEIELTDAEFAPALAALLVDDGPEGYGPVDFRSLSVREFGTIYEGLLESRLSVAQDDLALKKLKGQFQYVPFWKQVKGKPDLVPITKNATIEVSAGEIYFHNRSGVRKATGSYFTKPFAVEHLLDHALEPALDDHLARLDELREAGDDAKVAKSFFDFRCADIAMGSGHFLVAAVDRIEARFSDWLSLHPVPAITSELRRLRSTALGKLGELSAGVEIELGSLLRRQVARHCVYGVDKNQVAVDLARLALWIHTFVPGLPLSFLDHNLICGDSLTGVSSIDDAVFALVPGDGKKPSLFAHRLQQELEGCEEPLARLGRLNDADKAEVEAAREARKQVDIEVAPVKAAFDVVTAIRAGAITIPKGFDLTLGKAAELAEQTSVRSAVEQLAPVHYPTTWPEVFSREDRSGFECLLGNPPWEKVVVAREVWWGMHLPGVRSLPVQRRRARINRLESRRPDLAREFTMEAERAEHMKQLIRATFPKLGSGQTDLYKAFSWANLSLCRARGKIGIVLPRSAVADAGMTNWRKAVLEPSSAPPPRRPQAFYRSRQSSITKVGCSRAYTTRTQSL